MESITDLLLKISSPALGPALHDNISFDGVGAALLAELSALLQRRNGFSAYESALLVRPANSGGVPRDLETWNAPDTWRAEYGPGYEGRLFFAEDVFGCQFALHADTVKSFDLETGEEKMFAKSLEEWMAMVMADENVLTGYPLAHAWQLQNGVLQPGRRLSAKRPLVLGGQYEVSNFGDIDEVKSMRGHGYLARQIRDIPEGSEIIFKISD